MPGGTRRLVNNTGTTTITFLMVFPIQNTQYDDTEAIPGKPHELIRAGTCAIGAPEA